jgi:branched-chain amino acid transport system substrate-binding protein
MLDMTGVRQATRRLCSIASAAMLMLLSGMLAAGAAEPIKVGFSMALTGTVAPNGKQVLLALEIWRDDVNAKGGLLGRPIELVYYDDQSNPANVSGIYTKLISVDKVHLLLGPYATNMVAPAMPVVMNHKMTTISILAIGVNRHFNYQRYFSMVPVGPEGVKAFSRGFFEIAAAQNPRPQTVAILAGDADSLRLHRTGRARMPRRSGSTSSTTRPIRLLPPTSHRWCAPFTPPMPTWSSPRPIRRIPLASYVRRTKRD